MPFAKMGPLANIVKMKRYYFLIILWTVLISCSTKNSAKNEQVVVDSSKNIVEEEIDDPPRDSLGYPDYYVHPDFQDIRDLKKLLLNADNVVGYNFNDHDGNPAAVECEYLFGAKDKPCRSATNKKVLSQDQIKRLIQITCDTTTYTGNWSGLAGVCYIPHMGFGFFKKDSLIAEVSVCFICEGIRTRPLYRSDGMTTKGAERFSILAKELGLEIIDGSSKLDR